ncbi:MAG: phosphate/phosphite/phosphonate ABC transporter substrate-binding protein [Allorhizobium sp.]
MSLIACSRMYNLGPEIRGRWDALFQWLAAASDIELEVIAHAAPAPLSDLWSRPDMGAVFMCGYPFSRIPAEQRPAPLGAFVSTQPWAAGRPLYASHILATIDGPVRMPNDLAAARWGWTVRDSQSGYHAPRAYLADLAALSGFALQPVPTVGPLLNPAGIVAALNDGRIEAGAIDAYAFQLLSMYAPQALSGLRIVATTASVAAPLLIASPRTAPPIVTRLSQALNDMHRSDGGAAILGALGLERFSPVDSAAYAQLPTLAESADRRLNIAW